MRTALELPVDRHPAGVALDPTPPIPRAVEKAVASGVVALRPALPDDTLRRALATFFGVFSGHDTDALDPLLSRSARILDAHGGSTYSALRDELRGRIRAFEGAGSPAVRIDQLERFDFGDLEGEDAVRPRPPEMRPGDVLVRAHVSVPRSGGARLFGAVVVLLFRWEEDPEATDRPVLRIAGYDEEDTPSPRPPARLR